MIEDVFETLNTAAMSVVTSSVLSLYASGSTTCDIVESGDGVTDKSLASRGSEQKTLSNPSTLRAAT